jgi:cytochrome P450
MLELEPPRHTRLRNLVLRAFTSRRIAALEPEIEALATELIDAICPKGDFDLLQAFAQPLPVRIIARLLGVPEDMAPDLLRWSNAMVGMYMAGRTREMETAPSPRPRPSSPSCAAMSNDRRARPADDLITHLIAAERKGEKADHGRVDHHLHPSSERGARGDGAHHRQRGEDAAGNPQGPLSALRPMPRDGRGNPALRPRAAHVHPLGL